MAEVFISYAHADDQSLTAGARGWVTDLADRLQKSLAMKPGGAATRVWMDHRLEPNKRVDPALAERVAAASAFVAVLSPRYLESPWCRDEIEGFAARHGAAAERVFLVEMAPTARDDWPVAIRDVSTLCFWAQAFDDPAPMPLGWPSPDPAGDRPYWRALNELAHFISDRLRTPTGGAAAAPAATRRVWIAEPTDHVLDAWERLAAALRQQGIEVRPANPGAYPTAAEADWRAALNADLAEADLLLALFGPHPGRRPGWSDSPYTQLMAEAAAQVARERGIGFLCWRPPDVQLDTLPEGPHRLRVTGAVSGSGEALLAEVLARLATPAPAPQPLPATAGTESAPLNVCVQADDSDRRIGEQVRDLLFGLGVDASLAPLPQPAQAPAQWRQDYESLLRDSSGLLIVYGSSPASWVQAQVQAARKTLARLRRGTWGALLDAPPGNQPDHGVRSHGVVLLDCRAGLSGEALRGFVDSLRAGAAPA
ncbi:MAG: toll/interleukin-1 receptor domain-containing protein [Piscinibacter sp.]|nr:toll/interleukin-1 receptor domain-containing protein [Piscinibacter sp.]